ncbi:MAG: hypothetical protein JSV98_10780 [candidate division WOR-3 bacterium]|nr:MAG: hypothetical protein JSV98_10780 [candidate division WOR-3 bacterium]
MAKNEDAIIEYIRNFVDGHGGDYPSWYVGLAENPRERLITEHKVDILNDLWIFSTAENAHAARRIERHFAEVLKTDGGMGGGADTDCCVYVYRKNIHTHP